MSIDLCIPLSLCLLLIYISLYLQVYLSVHYLSVFSSNTLLQERYSAPLRRGRHLERCTLQQWLKAEVSRLHLARSRTRRLPSLLFGPRRPGRARRWPVALRLFAPIAPLRAVAAALELCAGEMLGGAATTTECPRSRT